MSKKNRFTKPIVSAAAVALVVSPLANIGLGELSPLHTEKVNASGFSGGSGTIADPYLVSTVTELDNIRNNLSAHYKLTRNIDLLGVNWIPIGSSTTSSSRFKGSLDGNGFSINNLKPQSSTSVRIQGLFGYVENASFRNLTFNNPRINIDSTTVNAGVLFGNGTHNVRVENVHIKNAVLFNERSSTGGYAGGVGGQVTNFTGSIRNVTVEIDSSTSVPTTGGLFGELKGSTSLTNGAIDNVSVKGSIKATGSTGLYTKIGGLIGIAAEVTIMNVVTDVNIDTQRNSGGIIGAAEGRIENLKLHRVFAYGSVYVSNAPDSTGTQRGVNIGGIIGSGDATFRYVYAYNKKIEGNNAYGTVGRLAGKDIVHHDMYGNAFEIIEGNAHSLNVADVILRDEVFRKDHYERFNFDFENTWTMVEGRSAPHLKIQSVDSTMYRTSAEIKKYSFAGGSGTVSNPYLIEDVDDFRLMASNTGAHFRLIKNLDLRNVTITPTGTRVDPFRGSFDGNGHTISNVNINSTSQYVGIFGYTEGAVIRNLTINNASIIATGRNYVGVITGYSKGGAFSNINLLGNTVVEGSSYVGALSGYYDRPSSIITTVNSKIVVDNAKIKGSGYVGGLIGQVTNGYFRTTTRSGVAAPVVFDEISINAEIVASSSRIGGFSGLTRNVVLRNAIIQGSVEGSNDVGGITNSPTAVIGEGGAAYKTLNKFENIIVYNSVKGIKATSTDIGGGFGEFSNGDIEGVFLYNSMVDVGNVSRIAKSWGRDSYDDITRYKSVMGIYQYETIPGAAAVGYVDDFVTANTVNNINFYKANSTMDFGNKWTVASSNGHPTLAFAPRNVKHSFTSQQENSSQFAGGTGTVEDPFLISTPTQFAMIAQNLTAHFKLKNDINFNNQLWTTVIGETTTRQFEGTFDGSGYTLRNLRLAHTKRYSGLFGYIDSTGVIKNLKINNVNVSSSASNTGVLAGRVSGAMENITIDGVYANITSGSYFGTVAALNNASYQQSTGRGVFENITVRNVNIAAPNTSDYLGGVFGSITSSANVANVFGHAVINGGDRLGVLAGSISGSNGVYKDINVTGSIQGVSYLGGYVGAITSNATHNQILVQTNTVGLTSSTASVGSVVGNISNSGAKFVGVYAYNKRVQGSKAAETGKVFGKIPTSKNFVPAHIYVLSSMIGGHSDKVTGSLTSTQMRDQATYTRAGMFFNNASNWNITSGNTPYLKSSQIQMTEGTADWRQNIINRDAEFIASAQTLINDAKARLDTVRLDLALVEINEITQNQASKNNLLAQIEEIKKYINANKAIERVLSTLRSVHYTTAVDAINSVSNSQWRAELNQKLGNVLSTINEQTNLYNVADGLVNLAIENQTKENIDIAQAAINVMIDGERQITLQERLNTVIGQIQTKDSVEAQVRRLESLIATRNAREIYSTTLDLIKEASAEIDISPFDERMIQAYINLQLIDLSPEIFYVADLSIVKAESNPTVVNVRDAQNKVTQLPNGNVKNQLQDRVNATSNKLGLTEILEKAITKAQKSMLRADYNAANDLFNNLITPQDINRFTPQMANLLKLIESAELVSKVEEERTQISIQIARNKLNELVKTYPGWNTLDSRIKKIETELENNIKIEEATRAVELAEQTKTEEAINAAKLKVNSLPNGQPKRDLQDRLTKLQEEIDRANSQAERDAKYNEALIAVEKAENSFSAGNLNQAQTDKNAAQSLVKALDNDEPRKDALQDRLNALQERIDKATEQVEREEKYNKALVAVQKAEKSFDTNELRQAQTDKNSAQSLVRALDKDEPRKQALQDRLDALQERIDKATEQVEREEKYNKALIAVEKAEGTFNENNYDLANIHNRTARNLVTALDENESRKQALQNRVDALQVKIDDKLAEIEEQEEREKRYKKALEAVEKAESTFDKKDYFQTHLDIHVAQGLVDSLGEYELRKQLLQERLNALQAKIEQTEPLDTPVIDLRGTTNSTISFEWVPVYDAVEYVITRNGREIARTSDTSYEDEELLADMTFYYTVTAVNDIRFSDESTPLAATTIASPQFQDFKVLNRDYKAISIEWNVNPNSEIEKFVLKRDGEKIDFISYDETKRTFNYTDSNLSIGENYRYTIATVVDGKTTASSSLNTSTLAIEKPVVTVDAVSDSTISLYWSDVEDASEYIVKRNGQVVQRTTAPIFADINLTHNTNYTYEVVAVTPHGESNSLVTQVQTDPKIYTIIIDWIEVEDAISYDVYRDRILIGNTTDTNFTDRNVLYGKIYDYEVEPNLVEGKGESINDFEIISERQPNVTVDVQQDYTNVTWEDFEDVYGVPSPKYQLKIERYSEGRFIQIGETIEVTDLTHRFTELEETTDYRVTIVPFMNETFQPNYAIATEFKTLEAIKEVPEEEEVFVQNVKAETTADGTVKITWDSFSKNDFTATRYRIQRYVLNEDGNFVTEGFGRAVTSTMHEELNLSVGKEYYFEIIPQFEGRYDVTLSGKSNTVELIAPPIIEIETPTIQNVQAVYTDNHLQLTWDHLEIEGRLTLRYRVQMYEFDQLTQQYVAIGTIFTTSTNEYTYTRTLSEGRKYRAEITPLVNGWYQSDYNGKSDLFEIPATTVPTTPTEEDEETITDLLEATAVVQGDNILLSWSEVANADRYKIEVYKQTTVTGEFESVGYPLSNTTTTRLMTNLDANTTYKFKITPRIHFVFNPLKVMAVTIKTPIPTKNTNGIKNLQVEMNGAKATVSWDALVVGGKESNRYRVQRYVFNETTGKYDKNGASVTTLTTSQVINFTHKTDVNYRYEVTPMVNNKYDIEFQTNISDIVGLPTKQIQLFK